MTHEELDCIELHYSFCLFDSEVVNKNLLSKISYSCGLTLMVLFEDPHS